MDHNKSAVFNLGKIHRKVHPTWPPVCAAVEIAILAREAAAAAGPGTPAAVRSPAVMAAGLSFQRAGTGPAAYGCYVVRVAADVEAIPELHCAGASRGNGGIRV